MRQLEPAVKIYSATAGVMLRRDEGNISFRPVNLLLRQATRASERGFAYSNKIEREKIGRVLRRIKQTKNLGHLVSVKRPESRFMPDFPRRIGTQRCGLHGRQASEMECRPQTRRSAATH